MNKRPCGIDNIVNGCGDQDLELILNMLCERYGVDFSAYRMGTIKRRLTRRMSAAGAKNYPEYVNILEKNPEEPHLLLKELTVKVSRFFRNRYVFELMSRDIFPDLFRLKEDAGERSLRIWCAGCAFGEEVYSVAITLAEYMRKKKKKVPDYYISIFGTDIDDDALDRARAGIYRADSVAEASKETLDRYFVCEGDNAYRVADSVKDMVNFCRHNIASEKKRSPSSGIVANYDLILCRNLLIYFSRPLQARAFMNLFNSLNPGGYLILGKSESVPEDMKSFFVRSYSTEAIYKKLGVGGRD